MDLRFATKICGTKNFPVTIKQVYNWHKYKKFPSLIHKREGRLIVDLDEWSRMVESDFKDFQKIEFDDIGKFEPKEAEQPKNQPIEKNLDLFELASLKPDSPGICPIFSIGFRDPIECKLENCAIYCHFKTSDTFKFRGCALTAIPFIIPSFDGYWAEVEQ